MGILRIPAGFTRFAFSHRTFFFLGTRQEYLPAIPGGKMLHPALKPWVCLVASLCLPPITAATALPYPDDSRLPPSVETWTPDTRIDALVESLVVGRWEIDSRDLGQKEDPQYRFRWVFHFSPDQTVEMRIWIKDGYGGEEGDPPAYFGLEQAGDWFIQGGRIGIISRRCHGFTMPAQRECDVEADEIGDTSFQVLQRRNDSVFLSTEESAVVRFTFKGRDRDMSAPAFWPAGTSRIDPERDVRKRTMTAGRKAPAFDVKGRKIAPGAERGSKAGVAVFD